MQEKTNRKRKNSKICNFAKIKKEIIKTKKNKEATSSEKIINNLNCVPNFIGCFAEDEISRTTFQNFPCFLIVNIDHSSMPGSHWLAVGVFKDRVEIFDPLGFKFFNWSYIPCHLLKLLHRLSLSRRVVISKQIQSDESVLCAFYCIYYCVFRSSLSFSKLCQPFKHQLERNDKILIKLFS